MQNKTDIRKTVLASRAGLSVFDREEKTRQITEKITEHTRFLGAGYLLIYVDFQSEVGTRGLIERAWRLGKRVFVPRVEGKEMEFYEIRCWEELKPGVWNIPEPKGDTCPFARIWAQLQAERRREVLAIFPGVAFDESCGRIGYGGGYYDRYFADKEEIFKLALAYDLQILEEVPAESTDLRPDLVITESRTLGSEPPVDRTFGVREEGLQYYDRKGAYLICFRGDNVMAVQIPKGYFLLGGGCEEGETHEECICREVMEETGYDCRVLGYCCSAEVYGRHEVVGPFHPIQYYYVGEIGEQVTEEHETDHRFCWLTLEEVRESFYVEAQRWAVEKAWEQRGLR